MSQENHAISTGAKMSRGPFDQDPLNSIALTQISMYKAVFGAWLDRVKLSPCRVIIPSAARLLPLRPMRRTQTPTLAPFRRRCAKAATLVCHVEASL